MEDELSIKELVNYYIKRYILPPSKSSNSSSDFQEMYGLYISQITRILKTTQVGETKLWDIIKPEKRVRKISIVFFEEHCFDQWAAYIKKQCKGKYDHIRLEKDIENHKIHTDEDYLTKKLAADIAEHNQMIEEAPAGRCDDEAYIPYVSNEEISKKGHEMMLEAIYEIFYESFNWKQLAFDLRNSIIYDNGFNPDVTINQQASIKRLKDHSNYVGKRKS